jgi:hypothetical protein
VLGSTLSWHSQLWAPLWSDRPFFYDDWLWYWQTRQVGPYNPLTEHAYDPASMPAVLSSTFLHEHGIGAVIVTETARTDLAVRAAPSAASLRLVGSGPNQVYLVGAPATVVTLEGSNAAGETIADQSIAAHGTSVGGTATIRRNWFPRWQATVNGKTVGVTETADGYMSVPIPAGAVDIRLRYVVDTWDWLARWLCVTGLGIAGLALVPGRFRRTPVRPRSWRTSALRPRLDRDVDDRRQIAAQGVANLMCKRVG